MPSHQQTRAQHLIFGVAGELCERENATSVPLLDVLRVAEQRARDRSWTPFWLATAIDALIERGELRHHADGTVSAHIQREVRSTR